MLENSPNKWMAFNVLQVNELSCKREIQKYEEISTIIAGISLRNPPKKNRNDFVYPTVRSTLQHGKVPHFIDRDKENFLWITRYVW